MHGKVSVREAPVDAAGTPRRSGAAEWLHLAAAPTFAIMALTTVFAANPADMLCSPHGMSPLNGMTMMYLLMSAFHAGPWLKLVAEWRGEARRRARAQGNLSGRYR